MTIRLACEGDIPGLIRLLYQVGDVHHQIRPDIFRPGAIKYTESELKQLLLDENSPIFVVCLFWAGCRAHRWVLHPEGILK